MACSFVQELCAETQYMVQVSLFSTHAKTGMLTSSAGPISLGDILEILPFEDPIVALEVTGATLWKALESALKPWPVRPDIHRRFPVISGFHVTWDSSRPAGERVQDVVFERRRSESKWEKVPRHSSQTYTVITRDYMAQGHDGYDAFKGCNYVIDEEQGIIMSSLVRRYLLGSQFIHAMQTETNFLHQETRECISAHWKRLGGRVLAEKRAAWRDAHKVAGREHMQGVDCFDGGKARAGDAAAVRGGEDTVAGLIDIHPEIDGRLRDMSRS